MENILSMCHKTNSHGVFHILRIAPNQLAKNLAGSTPCLIFWSLNLTFSSRQFSTWTRWSNFPMVTSTTSCRFRKVKSPTRLDWLCTIHPRIEGRTISVQGIPHRHSKKKKADDVWTKSRQNILY